MSKERETLITDLSINAVDGFFYITQKLQVEIRELLTQKREPLREGLREDLREGISLRDHFAGLAMQVLLVDATSMNNTASNAYDMADLMLAERGKNDH
jgi:hypothetical protein